MERAQHTHTESAGGGYECYDGDLDLPTLNTALRDWEQVYNTIRPHQALAYRTPLEYLQLRHPGLAPPLLSHM